MGGLGEVPFRVLFYQSALSLPPSPMGRLKSVASSLIYYRGNHCDKFVWGSLCCWRKHCHRVSLCPLLSWPLIDYSVADPSWFELGLQSEVWGGWQARILKAFEVIGQSMSVIDQMIVGMWMEIIGFCLDLQERIFKLLYLPISTSWSMFEE